MGTQRDSEIRIPKQKIAHDKVQGEAMRDQQGTN
jgi:hypothetical protein